MMSNKKNHFHLFGITIPFKTLSALLAITGAMALSTSMSLTKQLDENIPTVIVVFIRNCFGLLFFFPVLLRQKTNVIKTSNLPLQLLRVFLGFCAMLCTYYAYRNLPLAFATSIGMTNPIFVAVLSAVVLKESHGYKKWLFIFLGYIGVLIVINPTNFILDKATISSLLANLLAATCMIIIKILSKRDSTFTLIFYSNIGITLISFIPSVALWQTFNLYNFGILALTGILGLTNQFCSINAIKYCSPSFVAPFEYTRIVFAAIIGIIIFNEVINTHLILGSIIIIISTYMITSLKSDNLKTTT